MEHEPHTDYYGSLEHLPLAPLRKKPPPYASRRQQDTRRGSYLRDVLSSSTGDLTQAGNKTRVLNKSPGKDAKGRTKDRGDSSLSQGCEEESGGSGDVSGALEDATRVLSQHRRQGSVLYGAEERKYSDNADYHHSKPVREHTRKHSNGGTEHLRSSEHSKATENKVTEEHRHLQRDTVREEHTRNHSSGDTEHSREWHATENKVTEKHRHWDHKMQREREEPEGKSIEKTGRDRARDTSMITEMGRSRLDKQGTEKKVTERHRDLNLRNYREKEVTENKNREKYRDFSQREIEKPKQGTKFSRERAKSEGNLSDSESLDGERKQTNTSSLRNYRELAAIPDHTLVKWSRSKSLNDVTLDDGVDNGKVEYRKVQVCSSSDDGVKDRLAPSVGKEWGVDRRARAWSVGKMDVDARNNGNGRSYGSSSNVGKGTDVDGKNGASSYIVAKKVDVNGRNRASLGNKVDVDRRSGLSSSSMDKVEYRKVCVNAEEKTRTSAASSTSLSSPSSSVSYSLKSKEEEAKGADGAGGVAGVFVATPVFLEGSSSSSSPSSSPLPSPSHSLLQGNDVLRNKSDSTDTESKEKEEDKAALSTLRREILHLTRLKEEIEQNLLRGQSVLKEEVTGLRQEQGALAAAVEERERRLHSQQAEIQDLKGTIAQLQGLVFTSNTETRLQRQASDLQELLREEKQQRLEETTQLRREMRLLSSQLREKDQQLERYRSTPSLASWGKEGLGVRSKEEWKTSLPDVRGGEMVPPLGVSVAERRKSFSGMSDSSEDGPTSWAGSLEHSTAWSTENVIESSYIAPVRSYLSSESCRISERPQVAPGGSNIAVKSSRIPVGHPAEASTSKHIPVVSDMAVRPSRKSEMTPTDPSRAQVLPLRSIVPSDTVSGDEQSKGVMRSTLYVELHDYSKSGGVKEVPEGSHRSESDYSLSSETPAPVKTRRGSEEGQRREYLSRGLKEDHREKNRPGNDNRSFSKTPAPVKTRRGSEEEQRDRYRSGNSNRSFFKTPDPVKTEMRPLYRTRPDGHDRLPTKTQAVVTKPSQPSTASIHPSTPSTPPPSRLQGTREAGSSVTHSTSQEPPMSSISGTRNPRTGQKALQEASGDLGGSWQDPKGSRGVMGVKTSWMYKPVTGGAVREDGGQRGASGEKKDVAVLRGEKKSVDGGREERVERAGAQLAVSVNETGEAHQTPLTSMPPSSVSSQCHSFVSSLGRSFGSSGCRVKWRGLWLTHSWPWRVAVVRRGLWGACMRLWGGGTRCSSCTRTPLLLTCCPASWHGCIMT
ncbi:uncharacterized protein LOC123510134 isoform X2 [Portunus trituberculatus]|uniref:uncharacterized protein LOC123510134 isoform X2 n=1 Tax=Portunus trituberculatus TaxID=210409 RepID=UPI001E1CEDF0|nr:uncharacterized protein LOC123510134 isoform X2 [Portunus trituberculatus]